MTDQCKRQEYLDAMNIGGISNKQAVVLMFLGLVVPNLILIVIG